MNRRIRLLSRVAPLLALVILICADIWRYQRHPSQPVEKAIAYPVSQASFDVRQDPVQRRREVVAGKWQNSDTTLNTPMNRLYVRKNHSWIPGMMEIRPLNDTKGEVIFSDGSQSQKFVYSLRQERIEGGPPPPGAPHALSYIMNIPELQARYLMIVWNNRMSVGVGTWGKHPSPKGLGNVVMGRTFRKVNQSSSS